MKSTISKQNQPLKKSNPPDEDAAFLTATDDSLAVAAELESVDARGVGAADGEERDFLLILFFFFLFFSWFFFAFVSEELHDGVGAAAGDG